MEGLRPWAILSLLGFLSFLGASYDWFDADEFVNLQQAIRAAGGERLYVDTPSNHPPLYTEIVLRPLAALPGSALLPARIVSALFVWLTGLMVADLFRREVGLGAARTFLTFWTLNGFVLVAGTRAMNEAPLTALVTYVLYSVITRKTIAIPGAAAAAAFLVRYTALFFLPALLPRERGPLLRMIGWGALSLVVLLLPTIALRPDALQGLLDWTIRFHAERAAEPWDRRIGKTLWWSGVLFALPLAWQAGLLRRPRTGLAQTGMLAMAGALAMVLLPAVHVHYFLPCAVVVTAVAVVGVGRLRGPGRQYWVFVTFLLLTAGQGGFYVPQTPHHGLDEASAAADWIEDHTPPGFPILTDAPQYAILSGRTNWQGYYWSLGPAYGPERLSSALNETSLVAVSERFGHYDRGFPSAFLEQLKPLPCKQLGSVRAYWTGAAGETPSEFADHCGTAG
jgi:hypothetical protein